ncbi:hypothetical protein B0J13DRAFT_584788 [Dactylonectria estremocensis]|uniref:Uncharacterized protein n=1 Tax=Dactylonectria estremocensis TaxID=1079267 RepID=A0A9P9EUX7_9HYPO|nr:hypothetical protein B0J13DRAFT_584788 [Dactylonectria estremocensis]
MSRWSSIHFNKPSGMTEKMPPRLLKRDDIESARRFELYRLHSVGFELDQGDTLVIIDFPPPSKATRNKADCNGIAYRCQQFRVHSRKLLDINSPKFNEMLGPTYQFRTLRRRKLVNKLPPDVKYVLDLTPPSEGDELVFQMTELSLTPGINNWWSSSGLQDVDSLLVCGHDDICLCDRETPPPMADMSDESSSEPSTPKLRNNGLCMANGLGIAVLRYREDGPVKELPLDPDQILMMKARGDASLYKTPEFRRIPDYCPFRHRNGIIRLLMLIEGKSVSLDSACRVWTLVRLSKIFDCGSVIRDRVAQWIMHGSNTRFIEVLPEEALQIAFTLELPGIAQCAFRILVNELALKEADDKVDDRKPTKTAIFGRKLGDLPDELRNLVQHAALALVERVSSLDANLRNPDMFDYWDLDEWNRLRAIEQLLIQEQGSRAAKALERVRCLMEALVYEITEKYSHTTSKTFLFDVAAHNTMDQDRATYVEPMNYEKIIPIMKKLNPIQMLLCSLTYNSLGSSLDTNIFSGQRSRVVGQDRRQFYQLVDDVANALQDVIHENPMLAFSEAWAPCFDQNRPSPYNANYHQLRKPLINLYSLELGIKDKLRPITLSWLRLDIEPPLNITRHLLLTLTNNEMKFLPLWAGGCDDGTGGVFETQIPPALVGPNGPGPSYHTGITIPSLPSSGEGSMIDDLAELRLRGSTTNGSVDAQDSISTVYRRDQVIADDVSILSEAFTAGGAEYQAAKFEVPADHQSMGSAVDMLVEDTDSEVQSTVADSESALTGDEDDEEKEEDDDDADADMEFWNEPIGSESDSDNDSVVMIDTEHT